MYLSTRLSPSSARRVQVLLPSVAIFPVMFSKLVMFPLSASNEPEKEDLEELTGKLNDCHEMVRQLEACHEMVRQLEALKSTTNEEMKGYDCELVRLENAELLEDVDRELKQARRTIADLERLIDATNDVIETDEEEFATIADFEKNNKVAKHAPKDDDSDVDNNHISPAGVDVVVKPKKQDKKKSSAAKVDEELDILDDEVKEIELNLNDHIARIKRLEEIKSTLKKQKQDKKKSYAGKVDKELVILEDPAAKVDEELFILEEVEVIELNLNDYIARIKRLDVIKSTLKKPIDDERYSQADAKQMQLRVAVQATMEIVEKKKEELEAIAKKKKELKRIEK